MKPMGQQKGVSNFTIIARSTHTRNASLSSAVTLTVPSNAMGVFLQVESGAINYTLDGSTPVTGATGHGFKQGTSDGVVRIDLYPNCRVRLIEQAASAVIQYQFFDVL